MQAEQLTEAGLIFGASAATDGRNVQERLRAFETLCPFPKGLAVDLGCGRGAYVLELANRFERVIGVDVLPAALDYARLNVPGNVEFRCAPLETIPMESDSVDVAFVVEVLDHVNDVGRSIAELKRVLKPGAKAYVSVPNAMFPLEIHPIKIGGRFFHPWFFPLLNWMPFHDALATARIFHRRKLRRIFERSGLRVVASNYFIVPLEHRFKFMRPILAALGQTPLKPLISVSLVFALEKGREEVE